MLGAMAYQYDEEKDEKDVTDECFARYHGLDRATPHSTAIG